METERTPHTWQLPEGEGPWPNIVLLHSFGGLNAGYGNLTDKLASEGYIIITPGWPTFERLSDAVMEMIVRDSVRFLDDRGDVNEDLLGLTGFAAQDAYWQVVTFFNRTLQ